MGQFSYKQLDMKHTEPIQTKAAHKIVYSIRKVEFRTKKHNSAPRYQISLTRVQAPNPTKHVHDAIGHRQVRPPRTFHSALLLASPLTNAFHCTQPTQQATRAPSSSPFPSLPTAPPPLSPPPTNQPPAVPLLYHHHPSSLA